ncbi:MAG: hypothetical protein ACR2RV_29135, partial [Verrucomicrobiales bacterium]
MKNARLLLLSLAILTSTGSVLAAPGLIFKGSEGKPGSGKKVVLIAGDEEYRTEESCPMLGKILAKTHGFDATVLFSINPDGGYIDPNCQTNIPGTEAIKEADLVIIGTRFRNLPDAQLQPLADYLNAGKPIFGFRTATHAFKTKSKLGGINWGGFGPEILGEGWVNHYGKHRVQGARGVASKAHGDHPILNGVEGVFAESDVYGINRVTEENADILMHAVVTDSLEPDSANTPGKKPQPGVWLREYKTPNGGGGTALCTTMGSSCDLMNEGLRRLFINATYHLTGLEVPAEADVNLIDPMVASLFVNIREKGYYKKLNFKPADYGYGKSPQTTRPMQEVVDEQAAKAAAAAPKSLPGPKVNSTITSVEEQQKDGKRPDFRQPKDVSKQPMVPTTLPLEPTKRERLVFIGNGLAERMQHFG